MTTDTLKTDQDWIDELEEYGDDTARRRGITLLNCLCEMSDETAAMLRKHFGIDS